MGRRQYMGANGLRSRLTQLMIHWYGDGTEQEYYHFINCYGRRKVDTSANDRFHHGELAAAPYPIAVGLSLHQLAGTTSKRPFLSPPVMLRHCPYVPTRFPGLTHEPRTCRRNDRASFA